MSSHLYRKQAVEAAHKAGYVGFRTKFDTSTEMWKALYSDKDLSPAHEYAQRCEFVHHAEVEFRDGRKVGVLVVTITLEELHLEHGTVNQDTSGTHWFTPGMAQGGPNYIVEPLTLDLWEPDPPTGTLGTVKRSVTSATSAIRERSTAESPVKLVHRLADEMRGQPRKDVIAACVAAGVNKSTANTQFYHWQKAQES